MSIDDTDVLARLRAGAATVEDHRFDAHEVLVGSRRALRRRRSWQALGACTTAAAVAFSLALAGPVPVPGLGDVALPGSEQLRELLGITEVSGCAVPEPAVRRSAVEWDTSLRPGVTFDLAEARPMSGCFDVRVDGRVTHAGITPSALTDDGTFWSAPEVDGVQDYFHRIDPLDDGSQDPMMAPVSGTLAGSEYTVSGLAPQGDSAAWFELATDGDGRSPGRVILAAGGKRIDSVTGVHYVARSVSETTGDYSGMPAATEQRVAWRQEDATAGSEGSSSWGMPAWVAPIDSGEPQILAQQATALGGDEDEIVVATLDQSAGDVWTTTFTSFRDDGTETLVLTLEHPSRSHVPFVDITDDVLTYALEGDYHLAVVPRVDGVVDPDAAQGVAVRLGSMDVVGLSAAGDAVVWLSGSAAYLLRDATSDGKAGTDLMRIDQGGLREQINVGIAGDRIAWSTTAVDYPNGEAVGPGTTLRLGTLLD